MTTQGRQGATPPNLQRVRAYGDTLDDGQVQLSFSLPVPFGDEGREAAKQLVLQMGLQEPQVYHATDLGEGYSFYVIYARAPFHVDYTRIEVPKVATSRLNRYEIERYIQEEVGRKVVLLGACTGTDAHTVGIDAIMNMKGIHGEKGLESYTGFNAINLGSQVANERLVQEALRYRADALLVSQVVTQKDVHRTNLAELVDLLEAEGIRERMVLVAGGPRIDHELALELGFDAGFGPGTTAPDVATYVVQTLVERDLHRRESAD